MGLHLGLTEFIPLVAYLAAIIVLFLTLFYKIEIGIYFLVLTLPHQTLLDKFLIYPGGKDFLDIFVFVLLMRWFFNTLNTGERFLEKTPTNLAIVFLALWLYVELWYGSYNLGLPYPTDPGDMRVREFKSWIIVFLVYFIIVNNIKDKKQIQYLILVMAFSYFLTAYRSHQMSDAIRGAGYFDYSSRSAGTFSYLNANSFGAYLAQYALLLLALFLTDKGKWRRLGFGIAAGLGLYSMLFTFSRGGYLAAVVGLVFLGILKSRILLVILALFLMTWNYILPTAVVIRVDMTFNEEGEVEESAQSRFSLWEQARALIEDKPITGQGFDTTPYLHIRATHGLGQDKNALNTHFGYIQFLTEVGVVGLLIYLWQFGLAIKLGWKVFRKSTDSLHQGLGVGLVVCVMATLASNFTSDNWRFISIMGFYWVSLALVNRIWLNLQNKQESDEVAKSITFSRRIPNPTC